MDLVIPRAAARCIEILLTNRSLKPRDREDDWAPIRKKLKDGCGQYTIDSDRDDREREWVENDPNLDEDKRAREIRVINYRVMKRDESVGEEIVTIEIDDHDLRYLRQHYDTVITPGGERWQRWNHLALKALADAKAHPTAAQVEKEKEPVRLHPVKGKKALPAPTVEPTRAETPSVEPTGEDED